MYEKNPSFRLCYKTMEYQHEPLMMKSKKLTTGNIVCTLDRRIFAKFEKAHKQLLVLETAKIKANPLKLTLVC
jgi:hypothetical protein